jgi:hypothetical protein
MTPLGKEGLLTPEQVKAEVAKIRWYHTIDLGNGMALT